MDKSDQTKEERFQRLTEQRVNAILDKLRLLGQLSNRSNYHYTDAQVELIFKSIQKELFATKAKFRNGTKDRKRFSFSGKDE